jgi:hypothetical protein
VKGKAFKDSGRKAKRVTMGTREEVRRERDFVE